MRRCTRFAEVAVKVALVIGGAACAVRPNPATKSADPISSPSAAPPLPTSAPTATHASAAFVAPTPTGYVNDYAAVVPDSARRALEATLRAIRDVTEGEIVVVTMPDLRAMTSQEVAQRLGNAWGVGARSGRAQYAGAVVLVIPKELSSDGRGHCRLELGTGANAFIADSAAAAMCESAIPFFRARDYAKGIDHMVAELGRRYRSALGRPR